MKPLTVGVSTIVLAWGMAVGASAGPATTPDAGSVEMVSEKPAPGTRIDIYPGLFMNPTNLAEHCAANCVVAPSGETDSIAGLWGSRPRRA